MAAIALGSIVSHPHYGRGVVISHQGSTIEVCWTKTQTITETLASSVHIVLDSMWRVARFASKSSYNSVTEAQIAQFVASRAALLIASPQMDVGWNFIVPLLAGAIVYAAFLIEIMLRWHG